MILTENEIKNLPALPEPLTLRIEFVKLGRLRYISHLDLQRTMARVVARCNIPVWYTKGFNPHPKLVFAAPLPVGVGSECELLDLRLDKALTPETLLEMLNAKLTDELCAVRVYEPKRKFSDITAAEYSFEILTADASEALAERIVSVLTAPPLVIMKRTKSGDRETDIIPLIHKVSASYKPQSGVISINAVLACGQTDNLNPAALIGALTEKTGILTGNPTVEYCDIVRCRLLGADGTRFE